MYKKWNSKSPSFSYFTRSFSVIVTLEKSSTFYKIYQHFYKNFSIKNKIKRDTTWMIFTQWHFHNLKTNSKTFTTLYSPLLSIVASTKAWVYRLMLHRSLNFSASWSATLIASLVRRENLSSSEDNIFTFIVDIGFTFIAKIHYFVTGYSAVLVIKVLHCVTRR